MTVRLAPSVWLPPHVTARLRSEGKQKLALAACLFVVSVLFRNQA